jgi:hypothetical protein
MASEPTRSTPTKPPPAAVPYADWLKGELGELVDALELGDMQKRFIRSRWLEQVAWMESKANQARDRYYWLRVTTIVGAVLVPALVTVSSIGGTIEVIGKVAISVISLIVAASAAIEQFFHYGERWQSYRESAERLKAEGWLYLQLSGPYALDGASHQELYPSFAERVEEIIQRNVHTYLTEVAIDRQQGSGSNSGSGGG